MFQCCDMFVLTVKDDIVPAVGLSLCLSVWLAEVRLSLSSSASHYYSVKAISV